MRDGNKTKAQLIEDLATSRGRIAELEAAETERVRAEEALREAELEKDAILNSLVELVMYLDTDMKILWPNRAACESVGLAREELIGRTCYEVWHQRSDPCLDCPVVAAIDTGLPREVEKTTPDGRAWFVRGYPVRDESGDVIGAVEVTLDSIERKRAEEALRESEEQFREMVELLPEVVYECDAEGNLTFANEAAFEKFGYTQEDFNAGVNALQFIAPDDRKTAAVNIEATVRGAERGPFEYTARRKDGSEFPVIIYSSAIIRGGRPVGLRGIIVDITERKKAEAALRAGKERAQQYLDIAGVVFVVLDSDGRIAQINKRGLELLGYKETELIGEDWFKTCLPERQNEEVYAVFRQLMAGEAELIEYNENPVLARDGEERIVAWHNSSLRDASGNMVGILSSGEDVTERKQAERALEASEEKLRLMIDNSPIGFSATDLKGHYIDVNPALCSMMGYSHEEMMYRHFDQFSHPESRARNAELYEKLVEGKIPYFDHEKRYIHKTGKIVHALIRAQLVRDNEGKPLFEMAIVEDITERKQVEEERELLLTQIRAQATQMQQTMDTVPEGVLLLDAKGRVILANPLAEGDLAVLADAKAGDIITHLGDRPLAELLTSPPTKGLWHEVTADNRAFEIIARPMANGPEPENWVLVIRDVTQEREIQRRTQQQERLAAVGQLAVGIAHDFNNIMAVIVLYTQMGLRLPDIPAQLRDRLQVVDQQARRATELIQQILDFSRRAVLERRPMDLTPFLKEIVKLLERTVPESIKMEFTYGRDEYTVNADPTRVQQVVMNLAINARDAMLSKGSGALSIVLSRAAATDEIHCVTCGEVSEGEWVRIAVTDTGEGIPADVLTHIFEPFFTTKDVGKGTGLGLAQVYGIVKQHEGHIDVSTKLGAGTTFTVYLPPLLEHQPEAPAIETRTVVQGQGETILVVEDNADLRKALAMSVELLNYRVLAAADGLEALDTLEQHAGEVSLVLSDLVMPEMGGAALFHAMRQRGLTLPMVLLSGHPREKEMESLRELGLAGWMLKPPNMAKLSQLFARALREAAD